MRTTLSISADFFPFVLIHPSQLRTADHEQVLPVAFRLDGPVVRPGENFRSVDHSELVVIPSLGRYALYFGSRALQHLDDVRLLFLSAFGRVDFDSHRDAALGELH